MSDYTFIEADADAINLRGLNILENLCAHGGYGSYISMEYQSWMLENQGLGIGTFYNTPVSLRNFGYALALSSHPYIEELLQMPYETDYYGHQTRFKGLLDNQVLGGLWALDLGCGLVPMISRALRALGATVYTVDIDPASKFKVKEADQDNSFAQLERQNHIVLDYTKSTATEVILSVTNGHLFDYICTAQGYDMYGDKGRCRPPTALAKVLLRPGGVYASDELRESLLVKPITPVVSNKTTGFGTPVSRYEL